MVILNIGLLSHDGVTGISAERALAALYATGARVLDYDVRPSSTKSTLVAQLEFALLPETAHAVAVLLQQDCIAQSVDGAGELYGPGAEAWRPFNPAFFLTLE